MYLFGYDCRVQEQFLERVRSESGLTQADRAARAGTSRPTLSADEHGRKSPTLSTVERILDGAGYDLRYEARVQFTERTLGRGRPAFVADRLWRLPLTDAFATVVLSLALYWSKPGSTFALADRHQRSRCYEITLREGTPADLQRYVDGALLIDLWSDLVIPRKLRAAWQPLIDAVSQ